jgi:hypothetical protein
MFSAVLKKKSWGFSKSHIKCSRFGSLTLTQSSSAIFIFQIAVKAQYYATIKVLYLQKNWYFLYKKIKIWADSTIKSQRFGKKQMKTWRFCFGRVGALYLVL